MLRPRFTSLVLAAVLTISLGCAGTSASGAYEQTYLSAGHNWAFRKRFMNADRLLNAFDYGHAALYQTLIASADPAPRLEGAEFDFIATRLLRRPPANPLDESAIGPDFAKLAPEVLAMFDWAHMLHRQLYDVWSVPMMSDAQRDAEVARLVAYYRSRPDLAFSTKPKSMNLMEGQPYSLAFRRQDPKYNGLLWSYHWYQLALYDALIAGGSDARAHTAVDSVAHQFFAMVDGAPAHMPTAMPMAPSVAPLFSARYPDAAIIFDNLHALHDVVSDILVSTTIPRSEKRAALLRAAAAYRDDTTAVISTQEWRAMSLMMKSGSHR